MPNTKKINLRLKLLYILGILAWMIIAAIAYTKITNAQSISQSYSSDNSLQQGIIVQLYPHNSSKVEPVSYTNINYTYGVVINGVDSSIAITQPTTGQQVYVANSGRYDVLVSDQNGPIQPGDYITVSQIDGVGMKAGNTQPIVVGQALTSFTGKGLNQGSEIIKGLYGGNQTVHIGLIQANISIGSNPLFVTPSNKLPQFLQKLSIYVVGRVDTSWQVYISAATLLVVGVITITIVYSAVRSSIISIGRNPLSGKVITRGFIELSLLAVAIFIVGILAIYLILEL